MDRSIAPRINNHVELTKLPVEKVKINGIEICYVSGGSAPLLKIELIYHAGSKYQTQPLVASLAFDILKDGSKKLNGKDFKEAINALGVYYGFEISKDFGTLSFYVLERNLKALLDFIKDLITEPNLPEEEFNRLKVKQKNDFLIDSEKTSFLARQRFAEVLFNESEYGKVAHLDDFEKVGYNLSADFINDYIVDSPFKLLVAGCVSDGSKSILNEFASSLKIEGDLYSKKAVASKPKVGLHFIEKDSEQCTVLLGKIMPNKMHPEIHKISIANTLFGGYFGSRLMQNIREDKGWTYGIHSSILNYENETSLMISADVLKYKGDAVIQEVKKEIELLQSELVSDQELSVLKNYLKGKLLKSFDGAFEQIDRFFSIDSFGLDWGYYDCYIQELENITPEDLKNIANEFFKWEDFVMVKVGN